MSDKTNKRDAVLSDGTAVPAAIKALAVTAINAAWGIHEQLVSVSAQILEIGRQAVKAADGDVELALNMFNGSLEEAEAGLRKEHGKTKADKAKLETFLSPDSSWAQYKTNVTGGIKEGHDLNRIKSESSLRKIRKDAKEAKNAVSKATKKLAETFDVSKVPEGVDLTDLVAQATDKTDGLDLGVLQELAEEAGIPRAVMDEKRIHNEATAVADKFIPGEGLDKIRSAVATLLKGLRAVDMEAHGDRVANLLNQAIIGVNKLIPKDDTPKDEAPAKEPTGSEKLVEKNKEEFRVANA